MKEALTPEDIIAIQSGKKIPSPEEMQDFIAYHNDKNKIDDAKVEKIANELLSTEIKHYRERDPLFNPNHPEELDIAWRHLSKRLREALIWNKYINTWYPAQTPENNAFVSQTAKKIIGSKEQFKRKLQS